MKYYKELKMFVKTASITLQNVFSCPTDRGDVKGGLSVPFSSVEYILF